MGDDQRERFRRELTNASRAFKAAAVQRMRTLGVHAGQNFLLDALRAEEPLTPGELARRMRVEVPTVVRMAQRMEAAGMLRRSVDPDDRRRLLITLTPKGRSAAQAIPPLLDGLAEEALAGLDAAERDSIVRLLARVSANLDWSAAPADDEQV